MKKILIIFIAIIFLTGCTDINSLSYDDIVVNGVTKSFKYTNIYRKGYSYYLPKGIKLLDNTGVNDILTDNESNYYLYVDRISYHQKVANGYQKNSEAYYSNVYEFGNKIGYLEITALQNSKYLIEIMYNYAKIEVIVDNNNLNSAIAYSTIILSSVKYNDKVIKNLIEKKKTAFKEEEYNIFSTINNDSNILKYNGSYNEQDDNKLPDPDIID